MTLDFGGHLRNWRGKRRMSQLQLALMADVSARHIAFLETGRAKPSQPMVMRLGEALEVPRAERNLMLDAAGFRAAYASRPLDGEAMQPIRKAITHMIEGHSPYPAFVFDRHWAVIDANAGGRTLLAGFGLEAGDSFIDFLLVPGKGPELVANWGEVVAHLAARLRLESAHLGGDRVLDRAAEGLTRAAEQGHDNAASALPPVLSVEFRFGGQVYPMFSTITQFGTAEDIALADLKIEMFYPSDERSEALFRSMDAR